jgi:hypothetical protein
MFELGISYDAKDSRGFTTLGEIIWNYRNLFEAHNNNTLLSSKI